MFKELQSQLKLQEGYLETQQKSFNTTSAIVHEKIGKMRALQISHLGLTLNEQQKNEWDEVKGFLQEIENFVNVELNHHSQELIQSKQELKTYNNMHNQFFSQRSFLTNQMILLQSFEALSRLIQKKEQIIIQQEKLIKEKRDFLLEIKPYIAQSLERNLINNHQTAYVHTFANKSLSPNKGFMENPLAVPT